ncbi:MAG: hypothetical protein IBJ14_04890 [Hydrogenophaga sp.]|nr:hypothetical protein [Hydrogenophaga sp.]
MKRRRTRRTAPAQTYRLLDVLMASDSEPMPAESRRHQLTRMWEGLAALERDPQPSLDDWRVCSDAVNLMETLVCTMQLAEDPQGLLQDAVTALAAAGRRHLGGMALRLDAPGIRAVRAVLADYAEVLDAISHRQALQAHALTERRIRDILAGKGRPHDVGVMSL